MKTIHRYIISIGTGLLVLSFLIFQSYQYAFPIESLGIAVVLVFLIVFTTTFGVPLGGGTVSLLPMSTIATFLVLDIVPAGWGVFLGAALHQLIRQYFGEALGIPKLSMKVAAVAVGFANAAIQTISIMVAGWAYKTLGGEVPLTSLDFGGAYALAALALVYTLTNLLLAAVYMAARGLETLKMYLRSLPNLLVYEVAPLIFVPLLPLIYTRLGLAMFVLFSAALVVASLIARRLALTTRGLERRVKELDSLQIVGQSLSANLRLDELLPTIYDQVAGLMPADSFYVALYSADENEVSFPLAVEEGEKVSWRSRKAGNGLTEYVLRSGKPLLISSNVDRKLAELNIPQIGHPAASWLGVPMLSSDDVIGVIAVQSQTVTDIYDESHCDILQTIASQAAVAIQNAHLYEQTDEALTSRLRELNSILRTSAEGMLLLGTDFCVLSANRALANFLNVPISEISGGDWGSHRLDQSKELLLMMDYTAQELKSDCEVLESGELVEMKKTIKMAGPPERHLQRTLTPVLDEQDQISGWLLVFRDISEEVKLAQMREDLVHMLVHDLRSPLTVLKGSFSMLSQTVAEKDQQELAGEMIGMAERSTDRMMEMINGLLDIAKLEDGQMPLYTKVSSVNDLFQDVTIRVRRLVEDANLTVETVVDADIPDLQVDPQHIRRVLENLIDNAVKFTPDGGQIQLWARKAEASSPRMVLMGVRDTGPGIAPAIQKKIFQKFQVDDQIRSRRKGTGLGLAYCKLVVEAHGGDIWVESEAGQGANFIMRLPVARE